MGTAKTCGGQGAACSLGFYALGGATNNPNTVPCTDCADDGPECCAPCGNSNNGKVGTYECDDVVGQYKTGEKCALGTLEDTQAR